MNDVPPPSEDKTGKVDFNKRFFRRVFAFAFAFLIITSITSLDQYAVYGNTSYDDLLNQGQTLEELLSQRSPGDIAMLEFEEGIFLKPNINLQEGDRSQLGDLYAYAVSPGDTMSSIAADFGVAMNTIMMENGIRDANTLRVGTVLMIPPVDGVSHTVGDDQTLAEIAEEYEVEESDIRRQNQLADDSLVNEGAVLIIPGGERALPEPPPVIALDPVSGVPINFGDVSAGTAVAVATPGATAAPADYSGAYTEGLLWPTVGSAVLTQGYHGGHLALDIATRAPDTPVYASAAGTVITSGWNNGGYGNYIIIDHGNGMTTLYAHHSALHVSVGDVVYKGQTIATMGSTGRSTGPHVHWEVSVNGVKQNPINYVY